MFIRSDNGPEFVSRAILKWVTDEGIATALIDPGKPWQNGVNESFNGCFRAECLNTHWFLTLDDACEKLEDWRRYYNEERPHGAISQRAPITLINRAGATNPSLCDKVENSS
jgi:putative transposase